MEAKNQVTITVLMATFNTPFSMAKRAIDSVLNQDYQDFELIILDDGSDIETSYKLLEYVQHFDTKISYFKHKNRGQPNTINRGILLCNSNYISFIDADDEYKANHLSTCLNAMADYDLVATHTETVVNHFEDHYVPDVHNNNDTIHVDDCILFATLFGKTEVFKKNIFENKYGADSTFYEQVSKNYNVAKLPMRTYIYYRNYSNSMTAIMKNNID
jgi:glycosyltransferase involved in cell wall biosynthesis